MDRHRLPRAGATMMMVSVFAFICGLSFLQALVIFTVGMAIVAVDRILHPRFEERMSRDEWRRR